MGHARALGFPSSMTVISLETKGLSDPSNVLKGVSADGASRIRDGANRFVEGEFPIAFHEAVNLCKPV